MTLQIQQPVSIRFTKWLHGYPDVPKYGGTPDRRDPRNMVTFRILGDQFSGKSALAEAIATQYLYNGSSVWDVFGANDNEMLAWLKPECPFRDMVKIIYGEGLKPLFDWPPSIYLNELVRSEKIPESTIFVTGRLCYRRRADDFNFYTGLHALTRRWRDRAKFDWVDLILIREADEFVKSARMGIQGKTQLDVESEFATFHNQMVHYGYAVALDQHRDVDVAKKVRYLSNYLFFKNMGDIDMPRPWWPLRYLDPDRLLRRLKPHQFAVKTNHQCVGVGTFDLPKWHIVRGEGIAETLGIRFLDTFTNETIGKGQEAPAPHRQGSPLNDEVRAKIIEAKRQNPKRSLRDIGHEFKVAPSTVMDILRSAES